MPRFFSAPLRLACLALLCATGQAQVHAPLTPAYTVIRDVVLDTGESAEHVDITIHSGRITAIAPTGERLPAGGQIFEGEGRLALPGFIDTWTTSGVEMPEPIKDQDDPVSTRNDLRAAMRMANRKGVAPSALASDVVDFGKDGAGAWRSQGFSALLAAPSGNLLSGHGVLLVSRKGPQRQLVLNHEIFQFGELDAQGPGYPSTFMGYFAQLRQFFYDTDWQAQLEARYAGESQDPRPAWDPELAAGMRLIDGRELYVVRANRASDIERWIRLADEFQLRLAIAGGSEAWRVAELLKQRNIPVFLDLDFDEEVDDPAAKEEENEAKDEPEETDAKTAEAEKSADQEPEYWHYEEPMALKLERRRVWEESRDNAKQLHAAGVRFFFGTGDRKPKELMADLRIAIEAGLDPEVARRALTAGAARLLGLTKHAGEITVGADASFSVWTADPLGGKASPALMVIDGYVEKFDVDPKGEGPDEGVDASGTWTILASSDDVAEKSTVTIEMNEDGQVTGNLTTVNPMDDKEMSTSIKGAVSGTTLTVKGVFEMDGMEIVFEIVSEINGNALSGSSTWSGPFGEDKSDISGTRPPNRKRTRTEEETHYSCKD